VLSSLLKGRRRHVPGAGWFQRENVGWLHTCDDELFLQADLTAGLATLDVLRKVAMKKHATIRLRFNDLGTTGKYSTFERTWYLLCC